MAEAEVPDFLKSAGQHVLQETADELVGRDGHGAPTATAAFAIAEGDASQPIRAGFALDEPAVADGDAVDVGRQIAEGLLPVSDGLAMHHPGLVADRLSRLVGQATIGQRVQELGAIDHRRGFDGDEEIDPAGQPLLAVFADGSAGHDEMQVGMEVQIPSPCVQHASKSQLAGADVLGVAGQFAQRGRGGVEHGPIALARMVAGQRVEFPGQGERDEEIGAG